MSGLLRSGDWPALASLLEDRVCHGGVPRSLHVALLANAYLATSNTDGLAGLEAYVGKARPGLAARHALAFGIPHLLAGDAGTGAGADAPGAAGGRGAGRRALAARVPAERMRRASSEGGGNVEVAVLSNLVGKARDWLYAGDTQGARAARRAPP